MLKNCDEIRTLIQKKILIINPFQEKKVSSIEWKGILHTNVPSYGLEPFGYTFRISPSEGKLVYGAQRNGWASPTETPAVVDLSNLDLATPFLSMPPYSVLFGVSVEEFALPSHLCGLLVGKSTYTRMGISFLGTVLEPGWHGRISFSLVNNTPMTVNIALGCGIGQVLFLEGKVPSFAYVGAWQNSMEHAMRTDMIEPPLEGGESCVEGDSSSAGETSP